MTTPIITVRIISSKNLIWKKIGYTVLVFLLGCFATNMYYLWSTDNAVYQSAYTRGSADGAKKIIAIEKSEVQDTRLNHKGPINLGPTDMVGYHEHPDLSGPITMDGESKRITIHPNGNKPTISKWNETPGDEYLQY